MANINQNYPIKNTRVYQFPDGTYHVSFDANNFHYAFRGEHADVLQQVVHRVKRILHVR